MDVVLVGPGALGGLLAVHLTPVLEQTGGQLTVLDHNPDRAARLARQGLTLVTGESKRHVRPRVCSDPRRVGQCELLLICVKSNDLATTLASLSPLIRADTLVVGFQNGMTHVDLLRNTAGCAAAGVTALGASLAGAGRILFGGHGPTRLGLLSGEQGRPTLDRLLALLRQAGLEASISGNILTDLWQKLFVNVGINALTAIHNRKNGQLLTSCALRSTMKQAVNEAVAVAEQNRIPIMADPIAATFAVCRKTRANVSSMLQDVRRRKKTEIMAINGFVVGQGRELGIATPVNSELVNRILAIEASWTENHA